jgi:type 1 glutamine amidotransferase
MVALHQDVAHPLVWSKAEGDGRVAYIALGHSQAVWSAAPYQRLVLQTLAWLTAARRSGPPSGAGPTP